MLVNPIQLVNKAGQVLDELVRSGASTPAELAKAVAEPRTTVYRIGAALEALDLVRSADAGRWELGSGLLRWGDAVVESYVDHGELHKQLQWVRDQMGMSTYFWVPRERELLCLDHVAGEAVDMLDFGPGRILPLDVGAAPHAYLAFQPPEFQADVLAPETEAGAAGSPVADDSPRAHLDRTAERGWSLDDGEVAAGIAFVAVPVRIDGDVVGVISIAGLRDSVLTQAEAAAETLGVAAKEVAALMSQPRTVGATVRQQQAGAERSGTPAPALVLKTGMLLEALAGERIATSARLIELTGDPASSVYRMLSTLGEMGWVEQLSPRGPYRVGARLLTLATEVMRRLDIRRAAQPVMERIHEAKGETTFLCIRHGTRAVCIERIDGVRVNSRVLPLGGSLPLHVGSAPRALLAFEDRQAWEEYAAIATSGENLLRDVGSRSGLYAQLEDVRAAGVVISDNTVTSGIAAIGAPIFDHYGRVAASLAVSGPREGVLADAVDGGSSVRELVLWGADELSRYLGAEPDTGPDEQSGVASTPEASDATTATH